MRARSLRAGALIGAVLLGGGLVAYRGRNFARRVVHHAMPMTAEAAPSNVPRKNVTTGHATPPTDYVEWIYDGGYKGWGDWGWSKKEVTGPGPAKIDFVGWGGWVLVNQSMKPQTFGSLVFRLKSLKGETAEYLLVRVQGDAVTGPEIKVGPEYRVHLPGDWDEVQIPMAELNPEAARFDRVVIHASRSVPEGWTLIDKIGFTKGDPSAALAKLSPATYPATSIRPATMSITCGARATKINPQIYGIAFNFMNDGTDAQWKMGATMRRWGGNLTTRYNWQIHAWNLDSDWFFENKAVTPYTKFLSDDAAHGMTSALTVPIMGWVAKDTTSVSYPVSLVPGQEKTDPWNPAAGNGMTKDGKTRIPPGPPSRTSVPITPDFVKKWVEAIRRADAANGNKRSVHQYILDNEPALWQNTHRDVRTEPLGYDELLERTIQYGTAVRQADPDAVIAGPAEWGWLGYLYSGKDAVDNFKTKSDRKAHGDVPFIEWYLQRLREHEQKTGVRVLDVVDLHYYPQSDNVYGGGVGGTDEKTSALRLRSTRSLWDPDYEDESWIKEKLRILPRMKEWVAKNYPGRGLSIGEWSFGGEGSMSGALATAEALGRFGQFGLTSAFYWTYPPAESPTAFAFLAFRNFDGKGGRFLDWSLPTVVPAPAKTLLGATRDDAPLVSLFASRDAEGKHVVALAINASPDMPVTARIDVGSCGAVATRQAHQMIRGSHGLVAAPPVVGPAGVIEQFLPPYSITVVDIHLSSPLAAGVEN